MPANLRVDTRWTRCKAPCAQSQVIAAASTVEVGDNPSMLQGGRINRQAAPWSWEDGEHGVIAYSDASGVDGRPNWSWGGVLCSPDHEGAMLVCGYCPEWVTDPTTAELWGLSETGRLILKRDPYSRAALVCDNSYAVFAAVAVLCGEVPKVCKGPTRGATEAVLHAAKTGEGTPLALSQARACAEIAALGHPVVLYAPRSTPEMEIADELARRQGGYAPRRDSYVQRTPALREMVCGGGTW